MPPLLTAAQVCEQLAISRSFLYRLVHQGRLAAPLKVGRSSRWRQQDVDALLAQPRRLGRPRRRRPAG